MSTETTTSATPDKNIRPFYWAVRRELWENRSLYIAPLIVAGVVVIGFIFTAIGLPERRRALLLLDDPAKQRAAIEMPYSMAAIMIMFTAFIVGVFYCLEALHAERRDRSILFWKSLPVSDLTTVLSKVFVPFTVIPVISFAIIIATQVMIFLITSAALLLHGMSPLTTLTHTNLFHCALILLYGLVAMSLWHLPTYGWMLLVSAWARRAAFLWAILPGIAIGIFERITFGTSYFANFMRYRFMSWADQAFAFRIAPNGHPVLDSLSQLSPDRFLSTPGLWLGLVFAAVCLAAAVRLRRYRGPI
jgi:ABC-2 type transport system permease protein